MQWAFSGYASSPCVRIISIKRSMKMMSTRGHNAYPLQATGLAYIMIAIVPFPPTALLNAGTSSRSSF
jgi:hypothetical protein